jgi:anti-anti-sigma factor
MLQRKLSRSLYSRMLVAIIISITVVLALVTALTVRDSRARLTGEMVERGTNQIEILSHAANVYVHQNDAHQLTLVAKAATEGGQIQFVAFYGDSDELLATGADPRAPNAARSSFADLLAQIQISGENATRWSNGYLEIAKRLVYQGESAGIVALRMGSAGMEEELNRTLVQGITTTLFLLVVLSLAVGLLLRQFVIAPLRNLSGSAQRISAGGRVPLPGQERADELGTLARAFDQMVDSLQAREVQLQEQVVTVQELNAELDSRVVERTRELHELVKGQEQLLAQIREMSTPVVPVQEGVIVIPIVGSLDSQRAAQLIHSVLNGIETHRARLAVLDITGVPVVDSHVAAVILQASASARLLGTTAVLVGIRPEVAQTLVQLGTDLSSIKTFATLQETLRSSLAQVRHSHSY